VQDTVPHLIEQILAKAPTTLDELRDLGWLRVKNERRHTIKATDPV
jgi:hypothetical protein